MELVLYDNEQDFKRVASLQALNLIKTRFKVDQMVYTKEQTSNLISLSRNRIIVFYIMKMVRICNPKILTYDLLYNCVDYVLSSRANQSLFVIRELHIKTNNTQFIRMLKSLESLSISQGFLNTQDINEIIGNDKLYKGFVSITLGEDYIRDALTTYRDSSILFKSRKLFKLINQTDNIGRGRERGGRTNNNTPSFIDTITELKRKVFSARETKKILPTKENSISSILYHDLYTINEEYCVDSQVPSDVESVVKHFLCYSIQYKTSREDRLLISLCMLRCKDNDLIFGKCALLDLWGSNIDVFNANMHIKGHPTKNNLIPVKYGTLSLYVCLLKVYELGYRRVVAEYISPTLNKNQSKENINQYESLKLIYQNIGFKLAGKLVEEEINYALEIGRPRRINTSTTGEDVIVLDLTEDFIVNKCLPNILTGELQGIEITRIVDELSSKK